jgi:hypothetical protein
VETVSSTRSFSRDCHGTLYTDYWSDYFSFISESIFLRDKEHLKLMEMESEIGVCGKYFTCCFHSYWKQPVTKFDLYQFYWPFRIDLLIHNKQYSDGLRP